MNDIDFNATLYTAWRFMISQHPRLVIEAPKSHGKSEFVAQQLRSSGSRAANPRTTAHILTATDAKARRMARRIRSQKPHSRHVNSIYDQPPTGLLKNQLIVDSPINRQGEVHHKMRKVLRDSWETWLDLMPWKSVTVIWTPLPGPATDFFRELVVDWPVVRYGYTPELCGYESIGRVWTEWDSGLLPEHWTEEQLAETRRTLGEDRFAELFLVADAPEAMLKEAY